MSFNNAPNGIPNSGSNPANDRSGTPYTDFDSGYDTGVEGYPADNGTNDPDIQDGAEANIDTQQQLSIFSLSGVDNELEAMLRPLIDGQYTQSADNGAPGNNRLYSGPNTPYGRQNPVHSPLGDTPGLGPFPIGSESLDPVPKGNPTPEQQLSSPYTAPIQPSTSGRLKPLQGANLTASLKGTLTSPLSAQNGVPLAVARPGASSLGSVSMLNTATLGMFNVANSTGVLGPLSYTSPQLVQSLVTRMLAGFPPNPVVEKTPEMEQMLAGRFMAALSQIPGPIPAGNQPTLFKLVLDEILGYGPLESLLLDDSVQEIFVNGPDQVWVERYGQLVESDVRFISEEHLQRTASRMAAHMGRKLDRRWPMLDGRLPDGSRVNIVGPPCVVNGTSITIRKYSRAPLTLSTLVQYGTLSDELADFFHTCILGRLNIMIAGGSGSGKTTLLNALASFIPENERIVTIEESAELRLDQKHVVSLEVRIPDVEGAVATNTTMSQGPGMGEVALRHLLANALRMRAERILLGEMVGSEVLDLLMAMNTGHDGVMTTIHATTPRDALLHTEAMALMSGTHLPLSRIRASAATGVDLIIQTARLRDGTRRVIYVTEVRGMEGEVIALKDLFRWHEIVDVNSGISSGILQPTGETPRFIYRLQDRGQKINRDIFLDRRS